MRSITTALALAALATAQVAQAAQDPGLTLHTTYGQDRRIGVGVQAGVTIPLGKAHSQSAAQTRLSLRAGPSLTRTGADTSVRHQTTVAPLAELAIRPAHSTTWSLAGQRLAVSYAHPSLREADAVPEGPRNNLSTVAWVAIGVGAGLVVGLLLLDDAIDDASE